MSRETDELFRRARAAARPAPGDLARVRRGLDARIAAAAAGVTASASASGAVASKTLVTAGASLFVKVVTVVGVAGVAAGISYYEQARPNSVAVAPAPSAASAPWTRTPGLGANEAPGAAAPVDSPRPASPAATLPAASTLDPSPPTHPSPAHPSPTPSIVAPVAPPAPPPTASAPPPPRSAAVPGPLAVGAAAPVLPVPSAASAPPPQLAAPVQVAPSPPSSSEPPAERLAEEVALLRRVDDALARGDASAALAGVDEHAHRFPAGSLVEEREAARILALCAAGRGEDAARYAGAFRARYPRSTSTPRIDASCAGAR